MSRTDEIIADVRRRHAPDSRTAIFEVTASDATAGLRLDGATTEAAALDELVELLRADGSRADVEDRVRRLPEARPGVATHALIRAAVAPLYSEPRLSAPMVSQYVLGNRVEVLESREDWLRVRGEDAYIAWTHRGYLESGELGWAQAWERGDKGEPMVSLGAELGDEEGRVFARLSWGARVVADTRSRFRLPDGRRGEITSGEVVAVDRMRDRFPPRGESVARSARRWIGTPYLWGGVTPAGADCSGLVQSVYWMHGLALPRDSDQQARVGVPIEPGDDYAALRSGDLLFFSDVGGRVTHVAISLGGSHIIHCAIANAGVDVNDLLGERELEERLVRELVGCRRVLPDD